MIARADPTPIAEAPDSVPVLTFFNNKGGVGKTSLLFHLAWVFAEEGRRVVAADLDPQSNLTAEFCTIDRVEELWSGSSGTHSGRTIYECLSPIVSGTGDILSPVLEPIDDDLWLLPGDLQLSLFEDELAEHWPKCLDRRERSFRVISSFWRILQQAARSVDADLIMIDIGPNLGSINRTALIAADRMVVPLAPDLFSLQGLRNLGPTLRRWRNQWSDRRVRNPNSAVTLPSAQVFPIGYVVLQHSVRLDRPVKAYERWIERIPHAYHHHVLDEPPDDAPLVAGSPMTIWNDPECLGMLKHYRSLMPLAQEARKPIFKLRPADGLVGAHIQLASAVYNDFAALAAAIADRL